MQPYDGLPCPRRQKIVTVGKLGERGQIMRCAASNSLHLGEEVTPQVCSGCLVREALIVSQEKRKPVKFYLPATEDGDRLHRVIVDKPIEGSVWPVCEDRKKLTVIKPCGKVEYIRRCDSALCDAFGCVVTSQICHECRIRRTE